MNDIQKEGAGRFEFFFDEVTCGHSRIKMVAMSIYGERVFGGKNNIGFAFLEVFSQYGNGFLGGHAAIE